MGDRGGWGFAPSWSPHTGTIRVHGGTILALDRKKINIPKLTGVAKAYYNTFIQHALSMACAISDVLTGVRTSNVAKYILYD